MIDSNLIEGSHGKAERIDFPKNPLSAACIDVWLITAPMYHPLWSQYSLQVVTLDDDIPGSPPSIRKFPEATHELSVFAANPDSEDYPFTPESLVARFNRLQAFPWLQPINHAHQFEATDAEMVKLAWWACYGVVNGVLNPETGDAPTRIREVWKQALDNTLEHMRTGGHH